MGRGHEHVGRCLDPHERARLGAPVNHAEVGRCERIGSDDWLDVRRTSLFFADEIDNVRRGEVEVAAACATTQQEAISDKTYCPFLGQNVTGIG